MTAVYYPAVSRAPTSADRVRAQISETIAKLRRLRQARSEGWVAAYCTNDPTWLVDTAINRRAGWVEDPHARVTVNAPRLGRNMTGDAERLMTQLAHRINTPRLIVRERDIPKTLRKRWLRRLGNRITMPWEE